jgi:hypothetical protein
MGVDDIRDVPAEQYWDRLKSMMGTDGLMTYRYLGKTVNTLDDPDTMRIRRDMRNAAGGIAAAPLAIAAPETGGFTDVEAVPAPVTYSLHILDGGADVEMIRVHRSTVRAGRSMGFGEARIVDAADDDRVIALCSGSGISVGKAPPGFQPIDPAEEIPDTPALPPLHEAFGAYRRSDGHWALPELDPKLASTSASLHLGPVHVAFEVAATELAAERAGTDQVQVEDWTVMFVAPGKIGPFVVSGETFAGHGDRVGCHLTLRDEGSGDRVVSWGAAVFRPAHSGMG